MATTFEGKFYEELGNFDSIFEALLKFKWVAQHEG